MQRNWTLVLLLGLAGAARGEVVIYRCTDASGAVTIQNDTPCPKGNKQQRRAVEATPAGSQPPVFAPPTPRTALPSPPPASPAITHAAAPTVRPPTPPPEASSIAADARLRPPALYECRTYDKGRYISEDGDPPPRCAPLQVTDLGGGGSRIAGSACQMVEDQCERIPDEALCDSWKQRLRDTEAQVRFGVAGQHGQSQASVDRMQRIVSESTCGR